MAINYDRLKRTYKKGFHKYIRKMGEDHVITVVLEPYSVDCPNCIIDNARNVSTNRYDSSFVRPVNIFPSTPCQEKVYPVPFNVTAAPSGIQYDPAIIDPKPIVATLCPVCAGAGVLTADNNKCIKGLVTWNPKEEFLDLSAGNEGQPICRVKTFAKNYALCREAKSYIVDGVKCKLHIQPKVKGLGEDHVTEMYLIATEVKHSVSDRFDGDTRLDANPIGRVSDQADSGTPDTPPTTPGDDVW